MFKLIFLLLIIQYVVVYVKYKGDKYILPSDFRGDLIPGNFWYKLLKGLFK